MVYKMESIGYYSPQDLLSDYQLYGCHRLPIAASAFPEKYLTLASQLGSDTVSFIKKRELRRSPLYEKLLSFPPVAYERKPFKFGNKIMYEADSVVLNKKQLRQHEQYVNSVDDEELHPAIVDIPVKDWETVEQKESKELEASKL